MNSTDKLWGVKDLAEYLGIPVQTIYQWRAKAMGRLVDGSGSTSASCRRRSAPGSLR
jgi:hypothetical protein